MQECKLIFQRLKLSPNERLETYVWQHDIADIEIDNTEFDDNNDDNPYDSENEGEDVDDNAFPELHLEQDDFKLAIHTMLVYLMGSQWCRHRQCLWWLLRRG